jgi:RNA polymerase sigma factor (TIGR02999 family)
MLKTATRANVSAERNMTGDPVSTSSELTSLLQAWSSGDKQALEQLAPRVQAELHRIAARYMAGERSDHSLQATALINEAYIRLIDWKGVRWQNRAHFFAMAAQLMRRILVDFARTRNQVKRGNGIPAAPLEEGWGAHAEKSKDLVLLDEALTKLAQLDPRKAQLIELRFFGGLSVPETALVLEVSERTVLREWTLAKAWLFREIGDGFQSPFTP